MHKTTSGRPAPGDVSRPRLSTGGEGASCAQDCTHLLGSEPIMGGPELNEWTELPVVPARRDTVRLCYASQTCLCGLTCGHHDSCMFFCEHICIFDIWYYHTFILFVFFSQFAHVQIASQPQEPKSSHGRTGAQGISCGSTSLSLSLSIFCYSSFSIYLSIYTMSTVYKVGGCHVILLSGC